MHWSLLVACAPDDGSSAGTSPVTRTLDLVDVAPGLEPVRADRDVVADEIALAAAERGYAVVEGSASAFDAATCADLIAVYGHCYGNNPAIPYVSLRFPDRGTDGPDRSWRLEADEALVVVLQAPPPLRYWSYRTCLTDWFLPDGSAAEPGPRAAMGDTLNHLRVTTDAGTPFSGHLVIVSSASRAAERAAVALLDGVVFPSSGVAADAVVAFDRMVDDDRELVLGSGPTADTFQLMMRPANLAPEGDPSPDPLGVDGGAGWIHELPIRVLRVSTGAPLERHCTDLSRPDLCSVSRPWGGQDETGTQGGPDLRRWVTWMSDRFPRSPTLEATGLVGRWSESSQYTGFGCIADPAFVSCKGSGPDASISQLPSTLIDDPDELVVVFGVNHHAFARTDDGARPRYAYSALTVGNASFLAGMASIDDTELLGSVQGVLVDWAGVSLPADFPPPDHLFAYVFARTCPAEIADWCYEVPDRAAEESPTIGVAVGPEPPAERLDLSERVYVDADAGTRPDPALLVAATALWFHRR